LIRFFSSERGVAGMLLSMTGYGEARHQSDALSLSIELRALNNRYLKVTLRAPEPYNLLEAEFEKVVRRDIKRGTIQIHLRIDKQTSAQDFRINAVALTSYLSQLRQLGLGVGDQALVGPILALPGVVPEAGAAGSNWHDDWPIIEKVLTEALGKLQSMRRDEGRAMAEELVAQRHTIAQHLENIRVRSPQVVAAYRDRLLDRVRNLLQAVDVELDRDAVLREVAIFAERSDIAEEVIRLATHLDHFLEIMKEKDGPGRKLEFLVQEMSRETNTIGSKANDVAISKEVVAIKHTLEQIRELIQNVE
jgi:uncharacterized protein (TIGR00255 family)